MDTTLESVERDLRRDNPTTSFDNGETRVGAGDPAYESWIQAQIRPRFIQLLSAEQLLEFDDPRSNIGNTTMEQSRRSNCEPDFLELIGECLQYAEDLILKLNKKYDSPTLSFAVFPTFEDILEIDEWGTTPVGRKLDDQIQSRVPKIIIEKLGWGSNEGTCQAFAHVVLGAVRLSFLREDPDIIKKEIAECFSLACKGRVKIESVTFIRGVTPEQIHRFGTAILAGPDYCDSFRVRSFLPTGVFVPLGSPHATIYERTVVDSSSLTEDWSEKNGMARDLVLAIWLSTSPRVSIAGSIQRGIVFQPSFILSGGSGSSGGSDVRWRTSSACYLHGSQLFGPTEASEVKYLLGKLSKIDDQLKATLNRIRIGMERRDLEDRLVDFAIALESLILGLRCFVWKRG